MDGRTLSYLRGRFGDYYAGIVEPAGFSERGAGGVVHPREPDAREWAYVGFERGMVRHLSLLELGDVEAWLVDESPRHVYYSSARYERPGHEEMSSKGWRSADLIFDLDADHLKDYDPDAGRSETLALCKDALQRLLDFVEDDLAFDDVDVVFSGGRGYHVHVYDERARGLDGAARREVVDYVKGTGLRAEHMFADETAEGDYGRKTPARRRRLDAGAWSRRIRDGVLEYVDTVLDLPEDEALERLKQHDSVGEARAERLLRVFEDRRDEIADGNLDVAGGVRAFWDDLVERAVDDVAAETDEPVTTDTRRLIRLPGSLHGGTGLRVVPLDDREELDDFEPLVDAVAFSDRDLAVETSERMKVEVGGRKFNVERGETVLPEYAAVHAMLNGAELSR
ncbi:MAG: DNA primase catalytic subunit PriS [Halobacteriales archaeon]